MKNNILPLAIGLILAVAAIFMLRSYLEDIKKTAATEAQQAARNLQANQVIILVARKPIPAGVEITPGMIDTTAVDRNEVNPDVVRSLSEIENKAAGRAITKGEPIMATALRTLPKAGLAGITSGAFSMQIPEGKRAVPLNVDNMAEIVEKVKPGDHVDVSIAIAMPGQQQQQVINLTIFQDIQILAVGDSYGQSKVAEVGSGIKKIIDEKAKGSKKSTSSAMASSVTVALDPDESNVIAFVQEHGKIRLLMRSPNDTGVVDYQQRQMMQPESPQAVMSYEAFFQYLVSRGFIQPPRQPSPEEIAASKPKVTPKVEVYRGDKKEVKERIQ